MWQYLRKKYKQNLEKISPTLCLAKWTQSNIYLGINTTHSCHHCPSHTISLDDVKRNLSALHNTKEKIQQRQLMLEGKRPPECDYCWRIEDSGNFISDRITKSFSPWSRKHFDRIIKSGPEGIDPTYLEVSFDNRCNLKCSYCGPTYSNSWEKEITQLGPWPDEINAYQGSSRFNYNEFNPYVEAFWQWFPKVYPSLHTFRITGGEPLLSNNTYKLLDYVINNQNKNIELDVNTNLSVPDKILSLFIKKIKQAKVKQITIHASCDSHGSAAEYARYGLVYNKWLSNCQRLINEISNVKIDIMVTYNVFSVTRFRMLLEDVEKINKRSYFRSKINYSISYLRNPEHLAVWVLPQEYRSYIEDQIKFMKSKRFKSTEINQIERILDLFLTMSEKDNSVLRKRFSMFVNEHDKRRQTVFVNSVPELTNFLRLCESI